MGGSGGGGGGRIRTDGDTGGGTPSADYCLLLRIDTVLLSPAIDRLAAIRAGTVLDVEMVVEGEVTMVGVFDVDHELVGSISSGELSRLLRCMSEGHEYVADVLKVEGAECRVRIHHNSL
jgi:hypothetical protein